MKSAITISNVSYKKVRIDIEGTIGVSEQAQFKDQDHKISTYESFRRTIDRIASLESSSIEVNIRSTGGSVNDALLIHDALVATKAHITTRCFGYVASAATIIAQAASPGRREMSANALYLIHRSVCSTEGNSSSLSQTVDLLESTDKTIAAIYARRSGRDVKLYEDLMNENNGSGRWLSAEEALDYGLVDHIIEQPSRLEAMARIGVDGLVDLWNHLLEKLGVREDIEDFIFQESCDVLSAVSDDVDPKEGGVQTEERTIENSEKSNIALSKEEVMVDNQMIADNAVIEFTEQTEEDIPIYVQSDSVARRREVVATTIKQIDDPLIGESRLQGNMSAYEQDARNFMP